MKQKLEKSVCSSNNSTHTHTHTHTHTQRGYVVKFCVILAMLIFSFAKLEAQTAVINMPSSVTVGVNVDANITINSCNADVSLCNWSITGANGQIVSTNLTQATMVFNTAGTYTVRAYLRYACVDGGGGRDNLYNATATKTVTLVQAPQPPIIISGKLINSCGNGMYYRSVSFSGLGSASTDQDGSYAKQVPYGWTGTIIPQSSIQISFAPVSQNITNATTNLSNNNFQIAPNYYFQINPCVTARTNNIAYISSVTEGESYVLQLTYSNGDVTQQILYHILAQ